MTAADPAAETNDDRSTADRLWLQILGPLRVWRGAVELDPGPPQQAQLLAMLLGGGGRPVAVSDLIETIWAGEAPPSAPNTVHKYVGALRHLLEPTRPPRTAGSYIHRRGDAYLCAAGSQTLDLIAFRGHRSDARVALAHQQYEPAMRQFAHALALWSGPAAAGLHARLSTTSMFASVNGEFLEVCTAAGALALQLGQPERVIAPLTLAAEVDALHEPVLACLVLALGAAGRQAEALAVFHRARTRLDVELGISPSPALVTAYLQVLELSRPAPGSAPERVERRPAAPVGGMVGRADEFGLLWQAVDASLIGESGLVVIDGEPGIGKTRLLQEIDTVAAQHGATVGWGRCRDGEGTPTLWPWVEIIQMLLDTLPADQSRRWLTGELAQLIDPSDRVLTSPVLPDSGARFRLFEQVVALIGRCAQQRPLVVIIDDLQWADGATLELFEHLGSRLPRSVAVFGATRDRAPVPAPDLVRVLARLSRHPRHRRARLHALTAEEVRELVIREDGIFLGSTAARRIQARTGGNPFFVRELVRLVADGAEVTDETAVRGGAPSTVLDMVKDRTRSLDPESRRFLEVAAAIGSEVELGVLADALGIDRSTCLLRLDAVTGLGLVEASTDEPRLLRFTHDVAREAVVASTPRATLATIHLEIANSLERGPGGDDVAAERLAHHLWEAGSLADPARTAHALVLSGRAAATKSAFDAADERLRSAATLARSARLPQLELAALTQLTAVVGMRSGYVGSAVDVLERAETLARRLGMDREAADLLFSRWAAHSQGIQLDQAERLARRLLRNGEASLDPLVRAYGWNAWGIHQWDIGEIGEAHAFLRRADSELVGGGSEGDGDRLRRDLKLLWPVMRALMTALHGDVDAAKALLDRLEDEAGDDPYAITVWSAFSGVIAALAGEPGWAERAAQRGLDVDPDRSFVFLGAYQRLALLWARAVSGRDPAGSAAEARQIVDDVLLNPPRSGLATWYGLLAEMLLAAGQADSAMLMLDRADVFLDRYGQRYPESLLLLLRSRTMAATGADPSAVRRVAEDARSVARSRGAALFTRRAETWLSTLPPRP